jgi:tight adherence protein B
MTLLLMAAPDLLDLAPGPARAWPAAATGTAVLCVAISAWLLGTRDHGARRARLLFGDGAAAVQGVPDGAGKRVVDSGGAERLAFVRARPFGAAPGRLGSAVEPGEQRRPWESRQRGESAAGGRSGGTAGAGVIGVHAGAALSWYGRCLLSAHGLLRLAGRHGVWCLVAGTVTAILGDSPLPLLIGLAALPVARRAAKASEERRARQRRADAVISLCGALAGEVRAGRHAGEALLAVVRDVDGLATAHAAVVAAARFGGDVPRALAGAAGEPGAEGLLGLAACWRVAVDSGAGLAAGLERLEGALRAERDQRAELRVQLAGARSTAVLLAGLPVLGLLMGAALGADPLHVLLHSGAGLGCLLVGGVLQSAGLWWALHIVRNGEGE